MHTFGSNPLSTHQEKTSSFAYRTVLSTPSQDGPTFGYSNDSWSRPPRTSPISDARRARLSVPKVAGFGSNAPYSGSNLSQKPNVQTTAYHDLHSNRSQPYPMKSSTPQSAALPELLTLDTALPNPNVPHPQVFTEAIVPYEHGSFPYFTGDTQSRTRGTAETEMSVRSRPQVNTQEYFETSSQQQQQQELAVLRAVQEGQMRVFSADGTVEYVLAQPQPQTVYPRAPPQVMYDVYDVMPREQRPQVQAFPQAETWYPMAFYYTSAE